MPKFVAAIVAALALVGVLAWFGLELYHQGEAQAQTKADLGDAIKANQAQAAALARVLAAQAVDAALVSGLVQKLQSISAEQTSQRAAFAKVMSNATPAEKSVLGSRLPAAVVQLFARSAGAAAAGSSPTPVSP